MSKPSEQTRTRILDAARRIFANCGYAGTSVQDIVRAARVAKPALYYHFGSKAGLYRELVDFAQDERLRLMKESAERHAAFEERLAAVLDRLLGFAREQKDLMRIGFATAFAAPGEVPDKKRCFEKGRRNFEFVHSLIKQGLASGEISHRFSSEELTMAIYGQYLLHAMVQVMDPRRNLKRPNARQIVKLFMKGACS